MVKGLKGCFFGRNRNETKKIFVTVAGLMNAKYALINAKLYQIIGMINLKLKTDGCKIWPHKRKTISDNWLD